MLILPLYGISIQLPLFHTINYSEAHPIVKT